MKRYKITFEFLNGLGRWADDEMTNNGYGFPIWDAEHIADDLQMRDGIRNVIIVGMPSDENALHTFHMCALDYLGEAVAEVTVRAIDRDQAMRKAEHKLRNAGAKIAGYVFYN